MQGPTMAAFEGRRETGEEHLHPAAPFGRALDEGHGLEVPWIRLIVGEDEPPKAVAAEPANDFPLHPPQRSGRERHRAAPIPGSASDCATSSRSNGSRRIAGKPATRAACAAVTGDSENPLCARARTSTVGLALKPLRRSALLMATSHTLAAL